MSWDIDSDEGRTFPWVCGNRDCGEKWDEIPTGEVITCEFAHCDVATCPCCAARCFSCNRTLCQEHWVYADLGDGSRKYDIECIFDWIENEEPVSFRRSA